MLVDVNVQLCLLSHKKKTWGTSPFIKRKITTARYVGIEKNTGVLLRFLFRERLNLARRAINTSHGRHLARESITAIDCYLALTVSLMPWNSWGGVFLLSWTVVYIRSNPRIVLRPRRILAHLPLSLLARCLSFLLSASVGGNLRHFPIGTWTCWDVSHSSCSKSLRWRWS